MSEYVFEGEVVKLNARDYCKWVDMYPALNLTEELQQIDEEFSIRKRESGDKAVKGWFSECYKRFNGRNKIAMKNARTFAAQKNGAAKLGQDPSDTRTRSLEQDLTDRSWYQ